MVDALINNLKYKDILNDIISGNKFGPLKKAEDVFFNSVGSSLLINLPAVSDPLVAIVKQADVLALNSVFSPSQQKDEKSYPTDSIGLLDELFVKNKNFINKNTGKTISSISQYVNELLNASIANDAQTFESLYGKDGKLSKQLMQINRAAFDFYVNNNSALQIVNVEISTSNGKKILPITIGKNYWTVQNNKKYFKPPVSDGAAYDDRIYYEMADGKKPSEYSYGPIVTNKKMMPIITKGESGYTDYTKAGQEYVSDAMTQNRFSPYGNSKYRKSFGENDDGEKKPDKTKLFVPIKGVNNPFKPGSMPVYSAKSDGHELSFDDLAKIGQGLMESQRQKGAGKQPPLDLVTQMFPIDINSAAGNANGGSNKTWGHAYSDKQWFSNMLFGSLRKTQDRAPWLYFRMAEDLAHAGLGLAAAGSAALLLGGLSIDNGGELQNPYVNFFNTIAREVNRTNYAKMANFLFNNILLTALNPNVVDVYAYALNNNASPRESWGRATERLGPSVLSILPGLSAWKTGKGKVYNPLRMISATPFFFGETWIPIAQVPYLDWVFDGDFSSGMEWRKDLEPKLSIAAKENPFQADKSEGNKGGPLTLFGKSLPVDTNTRVLNTVAKGQLQLKNLPGIIIRAEGGETPNKNNIVLTEAINSSFMVESIERQLDAEYCPFYFHDLRTGEIVAFHAFLTSLAQSFVTSWSSENYYGRSDPIPNLQNTTRTLSFGFVVYAGSPEDFGLMYEKLNKLITLVYPQYNGGEANIKGDAIPFSQIPVGNPIIRLRIGDYIKSNYSFNDLAKIVGDGKDDTGELLKNRFHVNFQNYGGKGLAGFLTSFDLGDVVPMRWETARNHTAPQMFTINMGFTAIHDIAPGIDYIGRNRGKIFRIGKKNHPNEQLDNDESLTTLLKKGKTY